MKHQFRYTMRLFQITFTREKQKSTTAAFQETRAKANRCYMDVTFKNCTGPFLIAADNPCIHKIHRRHETGPSDIHPYVQKTEDGYGKAS